MTFVHISIAVLLNSLKQQLKILLILPSYSFHNFFLGTNFFVGIFHFPCHKSHITMVYVGWYTHHLSNIFVIQSISLISKSNNNLPVFYGRDSSDSLNLSFLIECTPHCYLHESIRLDIPFTLPYSYLQSNNLHAGRHKILHSPNIHIDVSCYD